MNKFTQAVHHLLKEERFYAEFLLGSKIVWNDRGVKTAAVGIKNFTQTFYFNPEYVEKQTLGKLVGLIKHECLHALFKHVPFREENRKDHKMWNIAMDICINQYIREMPHTECTPEHLEKLIGKPVERFKDHIYYYNLLLDNKDKIPQNMEPSDDHMQSEDYQSADKQEIDAVLREQLMSAIGRSAGNIPTECEHIIKELLKAPTLSWKRILRNFIAKSVTVDRKLTRKKPHRRFGIDQPGIKKKRKMVIGVPIDSSGSVSDKLYTEFLTELQSIVKNVGKAYFIDADCEIHDVQEYSGNDKIELKRIGCGGTAYNPALKKCKELKCDAIIYMGDGDCADVPENPNIPVMWVLPEGCSNPSNFGKVLYLK